MLSLTNVWQFPPLVERCDLQGCGSLPRGDASLLPADIGLPATWGLSGLLRREHERLRELVANLSLEALVPRRSRL